MAQTVSSAPAERTVRLHRVLASPPEKVFRAFTDADALTRWLPPDGFTGKMHHMDATTGGKFRMSFTNFTTERSHSFHGTYLEVVPCQLLRYTDEFDDPNLPGELKVTVRFKKVSCGTELSIEQTNIPTPIALEACYIGWQQSLQNLARLVEPDIKG